MVCVKTKPKSYLQYIKWHPNPNSADKDVGSMSTLWSDTAKIMYLLVTKDQYNSLLDAADEIIHRNAQGRRRSPGSLVRSWPNRPVMIEKNYEIFYWDNILEHGRP